MQPKSKFIFRKLLENRLRQVHRIIVQRRQRHVYIFLLIFLSKHATHTFITLLLYCTASFHFPFFFRISSGQRSQRLWIRLKMGSSTKRSKEVQRWWGVFWFVMLGDEEWTVKEKRCTTIASAFFQVTFSFCLTIYNHSHHHHYPLRHNIIPCN